MNGTRLRAIIWKEFVQLRRDRATLGMVLGIPVIQLLMFGYAIRMDVRELPTAIFDQNRTQESRRLVERLQATDNFRVRRVATSYADAIRLIDRGEVRAAVVIPPDFAQRLKRGRTAELQVLVDASDPMSSQNAISAAQLVGQRENLDLLPSSLAAGARGAVGLPVDVRVRPLYNPALKSSVFIVPGIIGMILSILLMILTSVTIVRERERGTFEQLIVTPLTRTEIMIGKIVPYVLVGYAQMTAVLVIGYLIFGIPVRGSVLLIYAIALLFIIANLGIGLFVSTIVRTQPQAMQISYFFVLPSVLLSGFMFPREGMPPFMRELGLMLPLTHFLVVMRGVLLKGVGVAALWPQIAALAAFALLLFTFSVQRFQKKLE